MVVGMRQRTYEASEAAKREICAALKTLMAQKPLNKITIVEIMQSCGMARQHFYYHFEDIYDAVRSGDFAVCAWSPLVKTRTAPSSQVAPAERSTLAAVRSSRSSPEFPKP